MNNLIYGIVRFFRRLFAKFAKKEVQIGMETMHMHGGDPNHPMSWRVEMSNRIEVIHRANGDVVKRTFNEREFLISELVNDDPYHAESYRVLFDNYNDVIGCLYGENHEDPKSFVVLGDSDGQLIGESFGNNPKHPNSWMEVLNDQGVKVGELQSENPEDPKSWVYIYGEDGKPTHAKYGDGRIEAL